MKTFILFDHDGVLVDTEPWYYRAGERALADIGFTQDRDRYLRDMHHGQATWAQARAAGIDEATIDRQRAVRDRYYQEYLRTEAIEIDGVLDVLAALAPHVRMAIVTTSRRVDFDLIHEGRDILPFAGQDRAVASASTWPRPASPMSRSSARRASARSSSSAASTSE